MENHFSDFFGTYVLYGAIVPVALFVVVSTAVERFARDRGQSRPGPRGLVVPLVATSGVVFVVSFFVYGLFFSAIVLFLFAGVFLFFPTNPAVIRSPRDGAPGEVGMVKESPRSNRALVVLVAGLLVMVGSSLFVTAAIFSLLAMPALLMGVAMTISSLFRLSHALGSSRFRASQSLGGLAIFLSVFAMAIVQFSLTATFAGRNTAPVAERWDVVLLHGAVWIVLTGLMALGLWLRRLERRGLVTVVGLALATFVLTILAGVLVWPTVPLSL